MYLWWSNTHIAAPLGLIVAANDAKIASSAQLNMVQNAAADRVKAADRTAELVRQLRHHFGTHFPLIHTRCETFSTK